MNAFGGFNFRKAQGTREIGIRMALGAGTVDVLRLMVKLAAVALLASYLPARRAAKIDPIAALRF